MNCLRHAHSNRNKRNTCINHIHCISFASGSKRTAKLLTELKLYLTLVYLLTKTINKRTREENRSTWRKPLIRSTSKCHIPKPKNPSPEQDSNPCSNIAGESRDAIPYATCHHEPCQDTSSSPPSSLIITLPTDMITTSSTSYFMTSLHAVLSYLFFLCLLCDCEL